MYIHVIAGRLKEILIKYKSDHFSADVVKLFSLKLCFHKNILSYAPVHISIPYTLSLAYRCHSAVEYLFEWKVAGRLASEWDKRLVWVGCICEVCVNSLIV